MIGALVAAGADPNAHRDLSSAGAPGDMFGETPLHEAARWNADPAVVAALVEAGADPDARDNGLTARGKGGV